MGGGRGLDLGAECSKYVTVRIACIQFTTNRVFIFSSSSCRMHLRGQIGEERIRLLQVLSTATEFGCQWSVGRLPILSCRLVKGTCISGGVA